MTPEVRRALNAILIARTATNAGLRIVYPFLPEIARGLGTSVGTLAQLVALRNFTGVFAPLAARTAESRGRKWLMVASVATVAAGCALTASSTILAIAAAGIIVVGIAKPMFDVPMQAWLADRVPYADRGRIFGITELTWAASLLVTVPISGVLIALTDWRAPFVIVTALAVAGTVAVWRGIKSDRPAHRERRPLEPTAPRIALLAVTLLFSIAAETVFVIYGKWLQDSFGLTVQGIGAFTIAVVVAEVIGEGAVVWFADRVGLRRMIHGGLLLSAIAYLSFAGAERALGLGVVVVTAWIIGFEVTIVAAIPFASELAAESRDRMLSTFSVVVAVGRAVGALIALPLYGEGGSALVGGVASTCVLVASALLFMVPEPTAVTAD